MEPILRLKNVSVAYGSLLAAENISFDVGMGDFLCIVGENGSGKSSLIKAIVGILPICAGSIEYRLSKDEMAYLPQISSAERDFPATVSEVVLSGRQRSSGFRLPFYSAKDRAAANEAMELLEIKELAKRPVSGLSGGQAQRVMLARALCREPKLMILDEPSAGLDAGTVKHLRSMIKSRNRERKTTIVMVSHDMAEVAKYASHVAVLKGRLEFFGEYTEWLKGD